MKKRDLIWKGIIRDLFPYFVKFFFPNWEEEVDLSKGYVFLDIELEQILPEAEAKGRRADVLAKVFSFWFLRSCKANESENYRSRGSKAVVPISQLNFAGQQFSKGEAASIAVSLFLYNRKWPKTVEARPEKRLTLPHENFHPLARFQHRCLPA